jgi:hypothetical protein
MPTSSSKLHKLCDCSCNSSAVAAYSAPPSAFDSHAHLLHGIIHANGFGHLARVNGREGGSNQLTGVWHVKCAIGTLMMMMHVACPASLGHHSAFTAASFTPSLQYAFQLRLRLQKCHLACFACLLAHQQRSPLPGRHIHTVIQCVIAVSCTESSKFVFTAQHLACRQAADADMGQPLSSASSTSD